MLLLYIFTIVVIVVTWFDHMDPNRKSKFVVVCITYNETCEEIRNEAADS